MAGLTPDAIARALDVERRTVTNWLNSDPPCPSTGTGKKRRLILKQVVDWLIARKTRELEAELIAIKGGGPTKDDVAEARKRQAIAEAALVELEYAEKSERLVMTEDLAAAAGEIGERLQSVLVNLPSNYLVHLERLGVEPERAQPVLEEMSAELTTALRGALDAMELPDDGARPGPPAHPPVAA